MTIPLCIHPHGAQLGEGAIWSSGRIWWCDIRQRRLHSCAADGSAPEVVTFPDRVSALGRLADGGFLVASERELFTWHPGAGRGRHLADMNPGHRPIRTNDGRADRQGGFWIGTMSLEEKPGLGAFWRWYRGELRCLIAGAHIPNAQCFAPDGRTAYFSDTPSHRIMRWPLDREGWPLGEPQVHLDFTAEGLFPDGAITDSAGAIWCAFYGSGRVMRFDESGRKTDDVALPASQVTCPAAGGAGLTTLFVTSATQNMAAAARAREPMAGDLFAFPLAVPGLEEPFVEV
jgi:sugar lactone lactonase YvrE